MNDVIVAEMAALTRMYSRRNEAAISEAVFPVAFAFRWFVVVYNRRELLQTLDRIELCRFSMFSNFVICRKIKCKVNTDTHYILIT